MIRLLLLVPTLTGGGAEQVMITLLRHLDRSRFELALAVVDTRRAVFLDQVPADVELIDLRCTRVRRALPGIVAELRRRRPDVVLSTLGHLNLGLAMCKPFLPAGMKVIGRETTLVSRALLRHRHPRFWKLGYRLFYPWLDRMVCQSQVMLDDLVATVGFPRDKVAVIHNPVDIARIHSLLERDDDPGPRKTGTAVVELVAAGRLIPAKGFDLLLEALALCADLPLRLTLLGEGPEEETLRGLAASPDLRERVQFAGFVKDPFPLLAHADAFVLSSRFEGFPNVVLEALACGTAVIATPAPGGLQEIIGTIPQCEVAEEVTAPALAKAIRHWVGRRPGRVDPAAVTPFAVDRIVKQYEDEILMTVSAAPDAA